MITQLKAAIREVEEVGQQLPPKEEKEFSRSVEPHIKKASNAIRSFTVATQASNSFLCDTGSAEANDTVSSADKTTIAIQLNHQVLPEEVEIEQRKAQLEAVENLQQDIEDLQVLFNQFAQHVQVFVIQSKLSKESPFIENLLQQQEQATPVNQIEEHVETALVNVQEGERSLAKAARMKAALYPLTGALLGTCIGGPVGLFAGLKVGAVAALGGTFLGFTSGRVVKKWQEKEAEVPNTTTEDYHLVRSQSAPCGLQDPIQSQNPLPKTSTIDVG